MYGSKRLSLPVHSVQGEALGCVYFFAVKSNLRLLLLKTGVVGGEL